MVCQTYGLPSLWFAKPMVCMWVAFHENEGNHENDENDKDYSDSYKQGVELSKELSAGLAEITKNHRNDENPMNPRCKPQVPQTTGLEIPEDQPICSDLGSFSSQVSRF